MPLNLTFLYIPKPYLNNPTAQYGLGLLSLATYARDLGAQIYIIDIQDKSYDWKCENIYENSIILISACYLDLEYVNLLCKKLKEKNCYTIVGGPVTDSVDQINFNYVDCAVRGPGEKFIEKLIEGKKPKGLIIEYPDLDFDKYPIPDRRLLKNSYGGNIFFHKTGANNGHSTTLLTARGCPFKCAFCKSGRINEVYKYSLKRIKTEIEDISKLNIGNVRINDENILLSKERLFSICKLLDKEGISWRASIRAKPNDISLYNYMADHGCIEISVGIETADDYVLKILKKGNTVADNIQCVENALKSSLKNIRSLMMMSTPGETNKTLELNMEWAEKYPDILICLCCFYPFPGTDVYINPKKYNCIIEKKDNANIYSFRSDGTTPESHISIIGGLTRKELTINFFKMINFLEERHQINYG